MLSISVRRRLGALLLLLLSVVPAAHAQRRYDFSDWQVSCSRWRGDRDSERVCSVIEKTVPAVAGTLNIDGRMNGGVTVIGENRRDVLVRALVEAHARSEARAEELADAVSIRTENGRIFAEGPDTRRQEWWSVSFEVHVPAHTDLDLHARNGGLAVLAVTGTLRMETLNGGIHLDAVNGDVVAETMNGGLHVALDGDRWEGKGLDATTTNGGVHLSVPSGYSAHLETGTVNGGVDIDFPVTVQGKIGRRITTDLGRGGATLRLITTNGGVQIRRE
ncbi:MAG TPA: DUF4097 family beta strand repeat-containing protein [Gemmatimonadales bacterium]|jgi:hypothetical protein|nr:DUF4097 family beta strand repeat-containing protein [Gemmatimonadales bacterium]